MPSIILDPKPSDAAFVDPAGALSELPQFFSRIAQYHHEFIIQDDGFRGFTFRYQDIARVAKSFASRLRASGIRKGEAVVIWPESRPGWIAALWGCLLEIGMIASRLHVPVVPIRLRGLDQVLPRNAKWPRPGRVEVRLGAPIQLQGDSYPALAQRVETAVRNL
jgi:hypothetical protein